VLGWTANDPASVRRLHRIGVDAIVSDDPGMALETLATLLEQ
jgi:glycerophosphoryl diester phosphodiesterase